MWIYIYITTVRKISENPFHLMLYSFVKTELKECGRKLFYCFISFCITLCIPMAF